MLSTIFPDRIDVIRRLRSADRIFAEICDDYEALSALLPRDASDPALPAIRESLNGLENEIRGFLDGRTTEGTRDAKT